MDPSELERVIDRALNALPAPRAPRTLAPRVMQAVRLAESSAPATGWFAWSRVWQAASLAAMLAVVAGLWYAWPIAQQTLAERAAAFEGARVIWRVLHPVLLAGVAFVATMAMLCAAGAAALRRVA